LEINAPSAFVATQIRLAGIIKDIFQYFERYPRLFDEFAKIWLKIVKVSDKLCITVDNSGGNGHKRQKIWLIIVKMALTGGLICILSVNHPRYPYFRPYSTTLVLKVRTNVLKIDKYDCCNPCK
jgi:hypothetical protein